eukprot:c3564_g1_i1 orf=592-1329(+)
MARYTVQVKNVSSRATVEDIRSFFSYSGQVKHVDLRRDGQWSQVAIVSFMDLDDVDTAILLSGATIIDQPISVISLEDQDREAGWKHESGVPMVSQSIPAAGEAVTKAQDMVSSMVAKGYVLGKYALSKAKSFDEHRLTATAFSRQASVNKKTENFDKCNTRTSTPNDGYPIRETTKSAIARAHQGVTSALLNNGSALIHNTYIAAGGSWVSNAFQRVGKAAVIVSFRGKENGQYEEMAELRAEA